MNNCPNCGSPLEPYKIRCDYCGSYYFDFTAIDMTTDKPHYIKFRFNNGYQKGIITALAIPHLETLTCSQDAWDVTDGRGNILTSYLTNRTAEINAKFQCVTDPELKIEE